MSLNQPLLLSSALVHQMLLNQRLIHPNKCLPVLSWRYQPNARFQPDLARSCEFRVNGRPSGHYPQQQCQLRGRRP